MGCAQNIDRQLDLFLGEHCPDPALIRCAIARSQLVTVTDFLSDELVCRRGDRVTGCWLVLSGQIEIRADEQTVTFRGAGELVGEQGLLHVLAGKTGSRTADIKACGSVRLLCIDASFQQDLSDAEKVIWIQTLADVVNVKLEQATYGRSELRSSAAEHELLLRRFSDGDALGIVKLAAGGQTGPIQNRRVVVYFSDLANFSIWAANKQPAEVAHHLRILATIQIDLVRKANGQIDKLMGDGVMAYWFIDTAEREMVEPPAVLDCARKIVEESLRYFEDHGLELGIRIGLHAGNVSFGDFGAENRIAVTILGATVNLAARYEQAKSPDLGPIRLSPDLRDLILRSGIDTDAFRGPTKVQVKHGVEFDVYSI
ncbi:class 3 adenylate cyclase [Nitrobacteraceae bacterium AZCC 2146]